MVHLIKDKKTRIKGDKTMHAGMWCGCVDFRCAEGRQTSIAELHNWWAAVGDDDETVMGLSRGGVAKTQSSAPSLACECG